MKKQFILAIILFSVFGFSAIAKTDSLYHKKEYRNSVMLSAANFQIVGITIFGSYPTHLLLIPNIANQVGISAEHEVSKNLCIGVGYNAWNTNAYLNREAETLDREAQYDHMYDYRYPPGQLNMDDIGALRFRYGYKMLDITANYRFDYFRKHKLTLGLGLSNAWGSNFYVINKYFNYSYNFEIYVLKRERHNYTGIVLPLRYDYLFFRNTMAIGLQVSARKYFGLYSVQVDYGIHFSVNF